MKFSMLKMLPILIQETQITKMRLMLSRMLNMAQDTSLKAKNSTSIELVREEASAKFGALSSRTVKILLLSIKVKVSKIKEEAL